MTGLWSGQSILRRKYGRMRRRGIRTSGTWNQRPRMNGTKYLFNQFKPSKVHDESTRYQESKENRDITFPTQVFIHIHFEKRAFGLHELQVLCNDTVNSAAKLPSAQYNSRNSPNPKQQGWTKDLPSRVPSVQSSDTPIDTLPSPKPKPPPSQTRTSETSPHKH
jgi:hypothetical protein